MNKLNQYVGRATLVGAFGLMVMPFSAAKAQSSTPIGIGNLGGIGQLLDCLGHVEDYLRYELESEQLRYYANMPLCEIMNGKDTGANDVGMYNNRLCPTGGQVLTGIGAPALRHSTLEATRITTHDPGRQRCRFRMGLIGVPVVSVPAPVLDPKGGMMAPAAPMAALSPWEIFGDIYYLESELDQRFMAVPGLPFGLPGIPLPKAETEMFGGNLGARYMINSNWSVGAMVGYAEADVEQTLSLFGFSALLTDTDIDMWSISPFVSYRMPEIFPGADLLVDFLYSYGDQEYDTGILPGLVPGLINLNADGTTNTFDLNGSLVMKAGDFRHGPMFGLRYIDGEVDAATLRIGGASALLVGSGYDFESLTSTLGYQASYVVAGSAGSLVPQAKIAWEHEFEDNFAPIAGLPVSVDSDVVVLGAGLGWYADAGWNLVFQYEARIGDEYESHLFGLKGGVTF